MFTKHWGLSSCDFLTCLTFKVFSTVGTNELKILSRTTTFCMSYISVFPFIVKSHIFNKFLGNSIGFNISFLTFMGHLEYGFFHVFKINCHKWGLFHISFLNSKFQYDGIKTRGIKDFWHSSYLKWFCSLGVTSVWLVGKVCCRLPYILNKRFFSVVDFYMVNEVRGWSEGFLTFRTLIGPLTSVSSDMFSSARGSSEIFPTVLTLIGFCSSVNTNVFSKVWKILKGFPTHITFKWLFYCVSF